MKLNLKQILADQAIRDSLSLTLWYLLLFRFGLFILMPGLDLDDIFFEDIDGVGYVFSRENWSLYSIFVLGIAPYYMASVLSPVLVAIFSKDEGDDEKRIRLNRKLSYALTGLIAFFQAPGFVRIVMAYFLPTEASTGFIYWGLVIVLVTGAYISLWIAERISEKGVVDGRILLLGVEAFISLPGALFQEIGARIDAGQWLTLGLELFCWVVVFAGIIALTQAVKEVPIKQARIPKQESGESAEAADGTLIIPFNLVDEISIAAAGYLILSPIMQFASFMFIDPESSAAIPALFDPTSITFMLLSFVAVIITTYIYVAILSKPRYYQEALEQQKAYLPEVSAGESTKAYFSQILEKLALPLSICLGLVVMLPAITHHVFQTTTEFYPYFGGFKLFIVISLMMEFYARLGGSNSVLEGSESLIIGRTTSSDLVSPPTIIFLFDATEEEE